MLNIKISRISVFILSVSFLSLSAKIEQIESNSNKRVENKKQIKIDDYYSKFFIIIIHEPTTFQI